MLSGFASLSGLVSCLSATQEDNITMQRSTNNVKAENAAAVAQLSRSAEMMAKDLMGDDGA